jgi:hypothetical protein
MREKKQAEMRRQWSFENYNLQKRGEVRSSLPSSISLLLLVADIQTTKRSIGHWTAGAGE